MLNSQVSGVAIHWDCATLSHWSPANCKSRFQIISPHSAGSICRFWHCQSSDPPVHPLITGIPLRWFDSYLTGRSFRVAWRGEVSKAHQLVTGFLRDQFLDTSSSPHTVSCLPCHSNSTAWLYDSVRLINNCPMNFGQKSWCNPWWPADLQRAHCKDCSILQVCTTQHQKDQALSDRACCTTSCPGPCRFWAGLLQCSSSWTSIKYNQTSTNDSECSGTTGLQWAQKSPCYNLSSSPCTGYRLQLASSLRHWCLHVEQPQAQHPPTSTHFYESTSPPEVWDLLVSIASWYHHREAQNHSPEHSRSPFLDGGMTFPPLSGMLDPCQSSSDGWKLISFLTSS